MVSWLNHCSRIKETRHQSLLIERNLTTTHHPKINSTYPELHAPSVFLEDCGVILNLLKNGFMLISFDEKMFFFEKELQLVTYL